jgi:hypothetical protein
MISQKYDNELALYTRNLIERDEKLHNHLDGLVDRYISINSHKNTTNTKKRLFYNLVERYKIDTAIKISVCHFTKTMEKFAKWFSYMWHCPTLCQKTMMRLTRLYPYKTTHFLRQRKVWLPLRRN